MASNTIRPRAWVSGDVTTIKMIINHPMETGLRKDKATGKKIPAHYIETVQIMHKDKLVLDGLLGPAVSKNPFIQCKFKGAAKGDTLKISWKDSKGDSDSREVQIG